MAESRTQIDSAMVWGGMHGEEYKPGVPLVRMLQSSDRIPGVQADIANPLATSRGVRYVDANLALCITKPSDYDENTVYEARLVSPILAESRPIDLVVDVHENKSTPVDYAYVGTRCQPYVLGLTALMGIRNILVTEYGIPGKLPQAILLDISKRSHRHDAAYLHDRLACAMAEGLPTTPLDAFTFYAHSDFTYAEWQSIGAAGRTYKPMEAVPEASGLFETDRPVYAFFGVAADHTGGVEVITELDAGSIRYDSNLLHFPALAKQSSTLSRL